MGCAGAGHRSRFRRKVPEEGSGGRFRRVPVCAGVGSGGGFRKVLKGWFRKVLEGSGVLEAGFRRFRRVPVWFVALQP